jgi:hypothetical protein
MRDHQPNTLKRSEHKNEIFYVFLTNLNVKTKTKHGIVVDNFTDYSTDVYV